MSESPVPSRAALVLALAPFVPWIGPLVIGGEESNLEVPGLVAFVSTSEKGPDCGGAGVNGRPFCGGAMIHSSWALTAAHCAIEKGSTMAIVGKNDICDARREHKRGVKRVCKRPDSDSKHYDVALVELAKPAGKSLEIWSSALPEGGIVLGWGGLHCIDGFKPESPPRHVRQAFLPILGQGEFPFCPDHRFLAGVPCFEDHKTAVGPTSADSGSPLITGQNGDWSLLGIVNGGNGLGCFEEALKQKDWIASVIGGDGPCAN